MFDVLIPTKATAGCYSAHLWVVDMLAAIGISGSRDYLFAIDPIQANQIVLRTNHEIAGALGVVRPLPDVGFLEYEFCVRVSPMTQPGRGLKRLPTDDLDKWRFRHLGESRGFIIRKVFTRATMTRVSRGRGFFVPDVTLVGRLEVTNPELAMRTLMGGIGHHRAFGFGLLQLFNVKEN